MREYGLMNCCWPEDGWLHEIPKDIWVDQANTCWTGVELAFASFLIYEGLVKEGLDLVANVDERYRASGLYFDHQEFGGHYYRAMSAWAIVNAMAGLALCGGTLRLSPRLSEKKLKLFFASSAGTAHYTRESSGATEKLGIEVRSGYVRFERLELGLSSTRVPAKATARVASRERRIAPKDYEVTRTRGGVAVVFKDVVSLGEGDTMVVTVK
jgi:non-lysosomal glucosylceramidase